MTTKLNAWKHIKGINYLQQNINAIREIKLA